MFVVPAVSACTKPDEFTVATAVLVLIQEPPEVAFVNIALVPSHIEALPDIAAGEASTVADVVNTLVHPKPVPLAIVTE
jgi:hypothetical protein